jgi:hypothetical protein
MRRVRLFHMYRLHSDLFFKQYNHLILNHMLQNLYFHYKFFEIYHFVGNSCKAIVGRLQLTPCIAMLSTVSSSFQFPHTLYSFIFISLFHFILVYLASYPLGTIVIEYSLKETVPEHVLA